jgi:hypothetical protein
MASSLQQRIARLVDFLAQINELDQLRERVNKAKQSGRKSRETPQKEDASEGVMVKGLWPPDPPGRRRYQARRNGTQFTPPHFRQGPQREPRK